MRRVHRRGAGGTNCKFFIYPSKSFINSDHNLNIVIKEASCCLSCPSLTAYLISSGSSSGLLDVPVSTAGSVCTVLLHVFVSPDWSVSVYCWMYPCLLLCLCIASCVYVSAAGSVSPSVTVHFFGCIKDCARFVSEVKMLVEMIKKENKFYPAHICL